MANRKKAVVLISGGLDSLLAAKIMLEQGVDVVGVHLYTGLCITEHKRRTGQLDGKGHVPQNPAFKVADDLGIPLEILDISETYMDVITKPKYGRGSGVNPCKDCRIHMFEHAENFMREVGADFIATGEVLGQRPMSQVRPNLDFIHKQTGLEELILMPLSAKLLPETLPEREGWVDRESLYGISGRSRKPQLELVKEFGLSDYEQPAGGCCFLTDETYSRKFKDLFQFDPDRRLDLEDVILLGVGRHFRLSDRVKLVVGRYEEENAVIERHAGTHALMRATEVNGPTAVIIGVPEPEEERLMAQIVARYGAGKNDESVRIEKTGRDLQQTYDVPPVHLDNIEALRI